MKKISIILLLLMSFNNLMAQSITVKAKVIDSQTGEALMGVNVYTADNKNNGTVTDITGNFELSNVLPEQEIVFSFLGYKTKKIKADNITKNRKIDPQARSIGKRWYYCR